MKNKINSITLIGFPGIGKSQVGKLLAEKIGFEYIDTNQLLTTQYDLSCQQIIERYGFEKMLEFEEKILKKYKKKKNTIISTSGSLPFSKSAMKIANEFSTIVYLQDTPEKIFKAIQDTPLAYLLKNSEQEKDLFYTDREFIYNLRADFSIQIQRKHDDVQTGEIIRQLQLSFKRFHNYENTAA